MNNINTNDTGSGIAFQFEQVLNPVVMNDEPKPLLRQQPKPEAFPVHALGPILGPAVQRCHDTIKAPLSMCASTFLAAANLMVQPHVDIEIDGRIKPISELFLTLGTSGARKSAVDDAALNPIIIEEKSRLIDYEEDMEKFAKDSEAYNIAKNEATSSKKSGEEKMAALDALGEAPISPRQTDILLPDPNSEGLYFYLKDHQPSVGLFTDEAGTFLGGHAMGKDNVLKTCAFISKLWDGKKVGRNRVGSGSSSISGKRFAMHLMAQPDAGARFLNDPIVQDQGLPSRILVAAPEVTYGRKYIEVDVLGSDEVKRYTDHSLRLLKVDLPVTGKHKDRLNPRPVKHSPEAKQLFIRFHDWIESQMQPNGAYSSIRAFASKAPEHANRIALTREAFENLDAPCVSASIMADAIEIVQFYLSESVRLADCASVDAETELADELRKWLKGRNKPTVTLVDIYQKGPKALRSAKKARPVMMTLQLHHWASILDGGATDDDGVHRAEAWDVSKCL